MKKPAYGGRSADSQPDAWQSRKKTAKREREHLAPQQHRDPLATTDLFGEPISKQMTSALRRRFKWSPFSVINTRDGDWQKRKRQWLKLGIQSELGRGQESATKTDRRTNAIVNSKAVEKYPYFAGRGGGMSTPHEEGASGSSIFDPALCELMYSWFCPADGMVVDPFAGGSVRGVVAATLGREYWGAELRPEQVAANEKQGARLCPDDDITWVCDDAYDALPDAPRADFLFTCPPYGDLEEYSDDPRDISTMTYGQFRKRFRQIIERAGERLRKDSFAVIVVGDFRDRKTGILRGFVGDTVVAFEDAGMDFYNEIILVTAIGSLPIRIGKQFKAGRKIGKTHQQVLVFVKGDPKKATAKCETL